MKRHTGIIIALVGIILTGAWVYAEDSTSLSAEDEQAYQEAYVPWKHMADINDEVGLPPPGEEPERADFVGIVAKRKADAEQATDPQTGAQTHWEKRLEEVRPYLCTLVRPGETQANDLRSRIARQEKQESIRVADEKWANRDEVERELNEIAARYGVERRTTIADQPAVLAGEMDGQLIWVIPQNMIAAASVSADELWPTNSTPWASSSTGLGLTGTNIALGMWEPGGAVRETHNEFQARVFQIDQNATNPIPFDFHATGVAGTMAAGGVIDLVSPVATGKLMRGVAYQAEVHAHDLFDFDLELPDAAAGTTNTPGLRLSNHSWGFLSGWHQETLVFGTNVFPNAWVWDGSPSFVEDFKLGTYFPDLSDGTGSTQLDKFMADTAPRHLLLYAAGNDRFEGPGSAPAEYWWTPDRVQWFIFQNPPANERDWSCGDGNTYAYDTVAPPGTAKNVLTVGSALDVYHTVGSQTNWGYASNSVVTLSAFSGCGPTDDGRIKPDVVAIGQADPNARTFGIVTPSDVGDTAFQNLAGTSFASPEVTAGLALLMQRRLQLFPNLDPKTDALRGSTLKGLVLHTSDDIGNPGPDYQTGWGLFNAVSAVRQVELDAQHGRGTHIKELPFSVGETNSWLVYLDGSKAFKVTVPWSDPAGNPSTTASEDPMTPMLVNNIDILVETEDGSQTFLPWILNPDLTNETEAVRSANATNGIDNLNNIEQVLIPSPTAGNYRIIIVHNGGLAGGQTPTSQWTSVVSDGDIPIDPDIKRLERSTSTNQFLITFECDPGASLFLESSSNLLSGAWQEEGALTTVSWTNAVLASPSGDALFWRLRRETGL